MFGASVRLETSSWFSSTHLSGFRDQFPHSRQPLVDGRGGEAFHRSLAAEQGLPVERLAGQEAEKRFEGLAIVPFRVQRLDGSRTNWSSRIWASVSVKGLLPCPAAVKSSKTSALVLNQDNPRQLQIHSRHLLKCSADLYFPVCG